MNPKGSFMIDLQKLHAERDAQVASRLCGECGLEAMPRCTTDAGRREYRISGLCEICFDALFGVDDPE